MVACIKVCSIVQRDSYEKEKVENDGKEEVRNQKNEDHGAIQK